MDIIESIRMDRRATTSASVNFTLTTDTWDLAIDASATRVATGDARAAHPATGEMKQRPFLDPIPPGKAGLRSRSRSLALTEQA